MDWHDWGQLVVDICKAAFWISLFALLVSFLLELLGWTDIYVISGTIDYSIKLDIK